MPKITFKTRDEVPEGLRPAAKENGAVWEVEVVAQAAFDEIRTKNTEIATERDQLRTRVEKLAKVVGEDPEKFAGEVEELRRTKQLVEDGKLKGSDAIETEVARRLAAVKENYEAQLREQGARLQQAESAGQSEAQKRRNLLIEIAVRDAIAAADSGANPQATEDIISRARQIYTVSPDDKLVAKKGDAVLYGKDGVTPLPPKEWLAKLLEEAPYLRLPSKGGGADSSPQAPHGMTTEAFNKLDPVARINLARQSKAAK